MLERFAEGASEADKDPEQMPKLIELNVAYTDDEGGAIECMKKYWAGTFVPALFNQNIYTPRDSAANGEAVGSDVIKQKMCLSANPEDHVHFARRHIDLGFTHLYYHYAGPDQRAFLQSYGRDVLVRVRERDLVPA